ncbi:MAG: putative acetyltransferase [Methylobacteriaceae bacterium]|jgi:putative acetyltransferase|nr:putative acetyltransferase [Methylobacteriaceae bacterium]
MSARTTLRPYLPADLPRLAAIFRASIEELTAEDYNESQQAAWAALADADAFAEKLTSDLTLVALLGGEIAGFASLRGEDHIRMLYVDPQAAGQGVATALCDALEKLAAARGATKLTVHASDTARGFFEKRGYQPLHRQTVDCFGEWLGNTAMEKRLAANDAGHASPTSAVH